MDQQIDEKKRKASNIYAISSSAFCSELLDEDVEELKAEAKKRKSE